MRKRNRYITIGILALIAVLFIYMTTRGSTVTPLTGEIRSTPTPTALAQTGFIPSQDSTFAEVVVVEHELVGESVDLPSKTDTDEPTFITRSSTVFSEFGSTKSFTFEGDFLYEDVVRDAALLGSATFGQVRAFLEKDATDSTPKTESEVYPGQTWMYADYAFTVRERANAAGMKAAVAVLYLTTVDKPEVVDQTHAVVAFSTSDRGLEFFEPQDDKYLGVLRRGQLFPEPPIDFQIPGTYTLLKRVVLLW